MKARIRIGNMPQEKREYWDAHAEEYLAAKLEEGWGRLRERLSLRTIAALYLAASDQLDFGPKRARRLVEGAMEIIMGEAFESIGRGERFDVEREIDPTLDAMLCEMSTRGLYVELPGSPGYRTVEEQAARIGARFEIHRARRKRAPSYYMDGQAKKIPPDGGASDGVKEDTEK